MTSITKETYMNLLNGTSDKKVQHELIEGDNSFNNYIRALRRALWLRGENVNRLAKKLNLPARTLSNLVKAKARTRKIDLRTAFYLSIWLSKSYEEFVQLLAESGNPIGPDWSEDMIDCLIIAKYRFEEIYLVQSVIDEHAIKLIESELGYGLDEYLAKLMQDDFFDNCGKGYSLEGKIEHYAILHHCTDEQELLIKQIQRDIAKMNSNKPL